MYIKGFALTARPPPGLARAGIMISTAAIIGRALANAAPKDERQVVRRHGLDRRRLEPVGGGECDHRFDIAHAPGRVLPESTVQEAAETMAGDGTTR